MSLASAFSNATMGLNVASRRANIVSNNVANALTEGYSRRELEITSNVLNGHAGGVQVQKEVRAENLVATSTRRQAESGYSYSQTVSEASSQILNLVGDPAEEGSLAHKYFDFEASLVAAANDPSSQINLDKLATTSNQIAERLNSASQGARSIREQADASISKQVNELNKLLENVRDVNLELRRATVSGGPTSELKDSQHQFIDKINQIVPVKVVARDNNQVSLFTPDGGILIDGSRQTAFDFVPTPVIAQNMSFGSGSLSGLIVDGREYQVGGNTSLFEGGSLSATFEIRDIDIPSFTNELDALTEDLVMRFQNPTVDTTLSGTDAGIFTDSGGVYTPLNRVGLAGRVSLNSMVSPSFGGVSWKFRDGLMAATPGDVAQGQILRNLADAFQSKQAPVVGLNINRSLDAAGFATEMTSRLSSSNVLLADKSEFEEKKFSNALMTELSITGVDTDYQLQSLIEIENMYSANAKVISTLDDLLKALLEI